MKASQGIFTKPSIKSPTQQSYLGYLTQKQLSQLNKYKKDQESDRESVISGHSNKGRRMKLRNKLNRSPNQFSHQPSVSTSATMLKKKSYDFPDHHYRDAITRLKFMLNDTSYTPTKFSSTSSIFKSVTDDETDTTENTIIERSAIKEVSKYFPYKSYGTAASNISSYIHKPSVVTSHNLQVPLSSYTPSNIDAVVPISAGQPPSELLNFIEKQENYIEQLENESRFCRDELNSLMTKVKDVISENENLSEHAKFDTDDAYNPYLSKTTKFTTSGPNILFESRISELEAQLAQADIDHKKLMEENAELKRKRAFGNDSFIDSSCADAYKKQIENLQRDKNSLEETIKKLQKQVTELKERDAQVFTKTQKSRDLVEQANFERTQADIEIRRLKDELERQHERIRELQHETAKRIVEERANAERRYNYQVDQLGGDLTTQWEQSSKLQLDLERMKRLESDLKREIASKNNTIEELKSEIKLKTTAHLSDMAQLNSEKHSLEEEITSLRMQLERSDRQGKTEISRLLAENSSLRQRIDRADGDLLHSRRENLRLCDQISNLEKEIALGDIDKSHRPKDVKTVIEEMESKHSNTVQELESMISEQRQLMEKLTDQCKNLTQKLEDTTSKHKAEKQALRQTNYELMERLKRLWDCYKEKSLDRLYNSISSNSSSTSAINNKQSNIINDAIIIKTNVEFLTNRMNSASTVIAASNNGINEAYEYSQEPIVNSSSIHSSPKNYIDPNSYSTTSIQPETSQYVDESNANNNYSLTNDTSSYEPTSLNVTQIENIASSTTPTKSIIRTNSIKNINDTVDDAYYNTDPSYIESAVNNNSLQRTESGEWSSRPTAQTFVSSPSMDGYQQQTTNEYEYRRESRPPSRNSSRAASRSNSRSNSRPPSRPMSRASSQQRFYDEQEVYEKQQQQQPKSLSRNNSQRSLTDYRSQPDPIITTRLDESYLEPSPRKPSVTFKNDEYEQQSNNLQQVVEQRNPIFTTGYQQPQTTYEEPIYTNQSYYQSQPSYQQLPEYNYSEGGGGPIYTQPVYEPQNDSQQYSNIYQQQQQYEQPIYQSEQQYYQAQPTESRRQSPENDYYQQSQSRYSDSRRQSPEQEYPETPKRLSPPKRDSPPREYETDQVLQQRQQSRDRIYGAREETDTRVPPPASRQQSRDNISPEQIQASKSPSPTISVAKTTPQSTAKVPTSPKRSIAGTRNSKGGGEQKTGRNTMGETAGAGRKSDSVQKQPAKTVSNIRGKK